MVSAHLGSVCLQRGVLVQGGNAPRRWRCESPCLVPGLFTTHPTPLLRRAVTVGKTQSDQLQGILSFYDRTAKQKQSVSPSRSVLGCSTADAADFRSAKTQGTDRWTSPGSGFERAEGVPPGPPDRGLSTRWEPAGSAPQTTTRRPWGCVRYHAWQQSLRYSVCLTCGGLTCGGYPRQIRFAFLPVRF